MQNRQELINIISKGRPDLYITTIETWADYLLQLKGCSLQSVVSQAIDEEGWLLARDTGIGGSEIACICGKSPWNSAYQIWLKKTGQLDDRTKGMQSEPARWGNVLETPIADEWAKRRNRKYIHIPVQLRDDEHHFMFANIDGFTLSEDGKTITGILEIKTTSAFNKATWEYGPLPLHYICQTNWYTSITGLLQYTIVCLVGGQHLFDYDLPLDSELVAEMREAAVTFWNVNVKQLVEPAMQSSDITMLKAKAEEISEEVPPAVFADDETENAVEAYVKLRKQIGELEKVKDALQAHILNTLNKAAATSALTQTHTMELSKSSRRVCEWELLEERYPVAYAECVRLNVFNTLRIK